MKLVKTSDREVDIKSYSLKDLNISSKLYRELCRNTCFKVNGKSISSNVILKKGDVIEINLNYEENTYLPQKIDFEIIYEDEHILAINKDVNMVVHPTKGHKFSTLMNAIAYYQLEKSEDYKIRFVNRIDMDTSGIVIVAKNRYIQNRMSLQENIKKYYIAVVDGCLKNEIVIEKPILELEDEPIRVISEKGKYSKTLVRPILTNGEKSVVDVELFTGRTHQIRVHLKSENLPIVGDELYNTKKYKTTMLLHSYGYIFTHPITDEIVDIRANIKGHMRNYIEKLNLDVKEVDRIINSRRINGKIDK